MGFHGNHKFYWSVKIRRHRMKPGMGIVNIENHRGILLNQCFYLGTSYKSRYFKDLVKIRLTTT